MRNTLRIVLLAMVVTAFIGTTAWAEAGAESGGGERVVLNMFMGNSGVNHPVGVDPSDNWAIKIIEDEANVDLVLEVPNYADWATKLNLLLASGNLPDIVHGTLVNEMAAAADAGAFVDLKKYYDKSAQMKKVVSAVGMDLAKSPGGKYWAVPMSTTGYDAGRGVIIRWDLLEKYNGGKQLETVDQYVAWAKWMRDNVPGSVVLSSRNSSGQLFVNGQSFFMWYGAHPYASRIQDGKFISNIRLPEMKEALKLWRQLYTDGLVDKEFATQDATAYFAKLAEGKILLQTNDIDQLVPGYGANYTAAKEWKPELKGVKWIFAAPLKTYPAVLKDPKYTWGGNWGPIVGHRVAISAKSKYPDKAWKVLEAFAGDKIREAYAYGREGKEFKWENGQRVLLPGSKLNKRDLNDPDEQYWTIHLNFIWGFWPTEARYWVAQQQVPAADWKRVYDSSRPLHEWAVKNGPAFTNFAITPPEISKVSAESIALISAIIAKTIMGEYSMDDFDAQVKAYTDKYGFVDDYWTKYIAENKAKLKGFGAVSVDW